MKFYRFQEFDGRLFGLICSECMGELPTYGRRYFVTATLVDPIEVCGRCDRQARELMKDDYAYQNC